MIGTQEQTQEQVTAAIVQQTAAATAKAVFDAAQAAAIIVEREKSASMLSIVELRSEVKYVKEQQGNFEAQITQKVDKLDVKIDDMSKAIFGKLDELTKGRPSWIISWALTALVSLSVGLVVFIFAHM
jgi:hypothetical protein